MSTFSTGVQGNGAPPSNEPPTLRSKVIEILASTANGCLTELGYYPGMPQRLQELERQNAQWQQENVKLFRDNQALTHALHERNSSQQEKTIQALQTQVQRLIQEKSLLMKQNQTLLAGQPTAYQNLLTEYAQFQEHYQRALQEIRTFRHNNAVLSSKTPVQSPVTPGPVVFNPPIFGPQGVPPQVQKPLSSTGSYSIPENPVVNPKQPTIPVLGQQPRQIVVGDQDHARKPVETFSFASVPKFMAQRISQAPTIPDTQQAHPLASQASIHHLHPDQDIDLPSSISRLPRLQTSSKPVSSANSSRPAPLSVSTVPTALLHTRNTKSEDMAAYVPAPMSAPPIPQRHPFHSVPVVESPSFQQARPPAPNSAIPSRKYSLPLTLSHPTESSIFVPTPSALLQALQTDIPMTPSIKGATLKDTVNNLSLIANVNSNEEQKPLPGPLNSPVNHGHKSASLATPFEAVTPMNVTIDDPPTVTIAPTPPIESLKRPILVMLNTEGPPTPKKQRLDGQEDLGNCVEPEEQENVSGSVEPTWLEGQENVCSSMEPTGTEEQEKADSSEGATVKTSESSTNEDTEESEDEDIRVGPDGLRLVEDCLPALIEDDDENAEIKTCKLCTARFRLGYTVTAPKPFIHATTEELVQHCSSEHQSAWERLRNTISSDSPYPS